MISAIDYHLFHSLYTSVDGAAGEDVDIPRLFHWHASREENRKLLAELAEDDAPDDHIEREERSYFAAVESNRTAVASKLTLVSEMNVAFMADRKLWLWIDDALRS